jgi:hypothetical protein
MTAMLRAGLKLPRSKLIPATCELNVSTREKKLGM